MWLGTPKYLIIRRKNSRRAMFTARRKRSHCDSLTLPLSAGDANDQKWQNFIVFLRSSRSKVYSFNKILIINTQATSVTSERTNALYNVILNSVSIVNKYP